MTTMEKENLGPARRRIHDAEERELRDRRTADIGALLFGIVFFIAVALAIALQLAS